MVAFAAPRLKMLTLAIGAAIAALILRLSRKRRGHEPR